MQNKGSESVEYFMSFFRNRGSEDFLPLNNNKHSDSICNTSFQSEALYILPATHNLENVKNYPNLKYVTINNYKIGKNEFKIFDLNKEKLENVIFLDIWNIKQNDLELLKHFPNVTHLLISYIRKDNFCYDGIDYLEKLNTLCLTSVNKIVDFNFLSKSIKQRIKHLHITYTARLTNLEGIEEFAHLETLSLFASTAESRKTVVLESLNGIEKLSNLKFFEIDYFKFDLEDLKEKLIALKNLKQYKVNRQVYENRI